MRKASGISAEQGCDVMQILQKHAAEKFVQALKREDRGLGTGCAPHCGRRSPHGDRACASSRSIDRLQPKQNVLVSESKPQA
jgi:hypothetical protein